MQVNVSNFQQIKEDTCLNSNSKKKKNPQRPNAIPLMLCGISEANTSIPVFENLFPPNSFGPPLNHRVVGVRRVLTDHLVPTPCHRQGHLSPDQVPLRPIQP